VAAGLDKYRADNSVLIWDITKSSPNNENNNSGRLAVNTMAPGVELAKPIAEFGVSETAHSMAWFSSNSKIIAVGMNLKNIKFVDIRGDHYHLFETPSTNNYFQTPIKSQILL
jgi:hypothetical protein